MAILPIRRFGDPVLREPAQDVTRFDDALAKLADDMLETMYDAPGVGLAAPQIGLSLRFFVFDPSPNDDPHPSAVANPELRDAEGEQTEEEGCLSVPNTWSPTTRAMRIKVTGQDLDGNAISLVGEGLEARIFQHEVDHLNATLFIDRLSADDRRRVMAELRESEMAGHGRWRRRR